jgi:AcrR family transcriptional regulator
MDISGRVKEFHQTLKQHDTKCARFQYPMNSSSVKRRGPRRDGVRTRGEILEAARRRFAAQGFEGATMRAIAADAGVDPALVSYYFGSKSGLFVESLRLPVNPRDAIDALLAEGTHDLGVRLVTRFLEVWDDPVTGEPIINVLRSASSQPELLREFVERQIVGRFARAIEGPDAELRATVAATQMLGLAFARYVLRVEPLASAPREAIVALIAPTLQRYFDGPPP